MSSKEHVTTNYNSKHFYKPPQISEVLNSFIKAILSIISYFEPGELIRALGRNTGRLKQELWIAILNVINVEEIGNDSRLISDSNLNYPVALNPSKFNPKKFELLSYKNTDKLHDDVAFKEAKDFALKQNACHGEWEARQLFKIQDRIPEYYRQYILVFTGATWLLSKNGGFCYRSLVWDASGKWRLSFASGFYSDTHRIIKIYS